MDKELAEILIETLAPQLEKTLDMRGYRRGWPESEFVYKKGQPPQTRGAWVAAFLIEKYLRQVEIKATQAIEIALSLIDILLNRAIESYEFYRIHKKAPKSNISALVKILIEEYQWLIVQGTELWGRCF